MPHVGINVPASAGGAVGGARQQKPPMYTVVAYVKKYKAAIVVYKKTRIERLIMHNARGVENAAILNDIKTGGLIKSQWQAGGATVYVARVRADIIDKYLPNDIYPQ